jgi:hypothetical protein
MIFGVEILVISTRNARLETLQHITTLHKPGFYALLLRCVPCWSRWSNFLLLSAPRRLKFRVGSAAWGGKSYGPHVTWYRTSAFAKKAVLCIYMVIALHARLSPSLLTDPCHRKWWLSLKQILLQNFCNAIPFSTSPTDRAKMLPGLSIRSIARLLTVVAHSWYIPSCRLSPRCALTFNCLRGHREIRWSLIHSSHLGLKPWFTQLHLSILTKCRSILLAVVKSLERVSPSTFDRQISEDGMFWDISKHWLKNVKERVSDMRASSHHQYSNFARR